MNITCMMASYEFILHDEALVRSIAVIAQFCSGLQALNFLEVICQTPDTFRSLFVYKEARNISDIMISASGILAKEILEQQFRAGRVYYAHDHSP